MWFIKKRGKGENDVTVKAIHYTTNDLNFNELEVDWRGNVKYSTMMKKLCEFNPRREYNKNIRRHIKERRYETTDNDISS